jgi:2,4-dienoyl-CoA reductase-like NADH-dependent reductase (Old Yellow Enzyme family)
MDTLFTPGRIGTLTLPNRLVRSATAERMADADGRPRPQLSALYEELAQGGDIEGRTRFLRAVCEAVRELVGPDYPVAIKLGMMDGVEGGLTAGEGAGVVAALEEMGIEMT